jgi:CRP/FNR family transcriptional regulator, dissimilatory nitrate respiration regulator
MDYGQQWPIRSKPACIAMNSISHPTLDDLRRFPILSGLPPEQARQVLARARVVSIGRGEHLFHQGDPARRIWLCREGQLKLFRLSSDGQEKILAIVQPGRSFAEATMFLPERRYPVHCAALKASELVGFDADDLVDTLRADPEACFRLLGTLSRRMQEKLNQIESLALQNANLRVAHYLLDEFRRHESAAEFRLEASKKHIAGLLAIQPETLSRSLAMLHSCGVIDMDARRITISAPERLEQIARGADAPH